MERKILIAFLSILIIFFAFLHGPGIAGLFRVTPIRVDLDRESQISAVKVISEDTGKLNFQMRALEWTQDKDGKDRYAETDDLIFMPRIMTVTKDAEKTIRVGVKRPATEKEKTYRLFIEEIPDKVKREGLNISVAMRFGVPVFVRPEREEVKAGVDALAFSDGAFTAAIRNTGNTHISIESVTFKGVDSKGGELFSRSLDGWYLLHGVLRPYSAKVEKDVCKELSRVSVEVVSDRLSFGRDFEIKKGTCAPQAP